VAIPFGAKIAFCLLLISSSLSLSAGSKSQTADWPNVGNDKGGMRYSPLDQINRSNIQRLEPAWTYHTGDAAKGNGSTIECTPIEIGGILFLTTAKSKVVALDAITGTERWKFDPYADYKLTQPLASGGVNRGVVYWAEGKQSRIFVGTHYVTDVLGGCLTGVAGAMLVRVFYRKGSRLDSIATQIL